MKINWNKVYPYAVGLMAISIAFNLFMNKTPTRADFIWAKAEELVWLFCTYFWWRTNLHTQRMNTFLFERNQRLCDVMLQPINIVDDGNHKEY